MIYKKKKKQESIYEKIINSNADNDDKSLYDTESNMDFDLLISRLDYDERLIIILYYNSGFSCSEIASLIQSRNCNRKKPAEPSIYGWKIKCADCGQGMCRMEDYRQNRNCSNFYCRNYKTQSNKCSPHKIRTSDLNNIVQETILLQVKMVLELEKTIDRLKKKGSANCIEQEYLSKTKSINNDIDKIKKLKKSCYEDWKFEKITRDEYFSYSKDYDERIENYNKELEALKEVYFEHTKRLKKDDYWIEHFRRNKKMKALSKDIIDELIECIYVHEGGNVTIKFKYIDEYEKSLEFVRGLEENSNDKVESCSISKAV